MEIKWNNVFESPQTLILLFTAAHKFDLNTATQTHKFVENMQNSIATTFYVRANQKKKKKKTCEKHSK